MVVIVFYECLSLRVNRSCLHIFKCFLADPEGSAKSDPNGSSEPEKFLTELVGEHLYHGIHRQVLVREVRERLINQDGGTGESVTLLAFPSETYGEALLWRAVLVFLDLAILDFIINQLYEFIILQPSFILRYPGIIKYILESHFPVGREILPRTFFIPYHLSQSFPWCFHS